MSSATQQPAIPTPSGCGNLLLSRKKGEAVVVNDVIIITVEEIRGKHVRFSFRAPRHIPVHRQEVQDRIRSQQPVAAVLPEAPPRRSMAHARQP